MSDDLQEKVNKIASVLVKTDDGTLTLPDDYKEEVSDELMFAAKTELRRRTDQAAFTKSQQEKKALETTNKKLAEHLLNNATAHISPEQREELDELKLIDPDKWRDKINEYEKESKELVNKTVKEAESAGDLDAQLLAREQAYKTFTEETGIELSSEVIENELPSAYSKQLENGDITFDEFLKKSKEFLTKGKTTKREPEIKNQPNIGDLAGGSEPSEEAQKGDLDATYSNVIF